MPGPGNDIILSPPGADFIDGLEGVDTVDYRGRTEAVVLTLNGATQSTAYLGGVAEDTIVNVERVYGGSGDDILTGDANNNLFAGGAGNDMLRGGAGNDQLNGGDGIDTADYRDKTAGVVVALDRWNEVVVSVGGVAEDRIRNIERVYGGSGDDTLIGDDRANLFAGGDGDDRLQGGAGNDQLNGGDGVDTADYRDKTAGVSVTLDRWNEVTVSVGGVAEDTIRNIERVYGGFGNDVLIGDDRANLFAGGDGNDWLKGGAGKDQLNGGDGVDSADYSDKSQAVVVTLDRWKEVTVSVGGVAEDRIRNIENIYGGSGNDILTGDNRANLLDGGAGDDLLKGDAGRDTLNGGAGIDTADYRDRASVVEVSLGYSGAVIDGVFEDWFDSIEVVLGGAGNDILRAQTFAGSEGRVTVDGGVGDDRLTAGSGGIELRGGIGNDFLDSAGFYGDMIIDGGDGIDTLRIATGNVDGGAGWTPLYVTLDETDDHGVGLVIRNVENLTGTSFIDYFIGDDGDNVLKGEGGDDILEGGLGVDLLDGGAGTDTVDYRGATQAVRATLIPGVVTDVTIGGVLVDQIANIEVIHGGSGDDVMGSGSPFADPITSRVDIYGEGGDDTLTAGGANTYLHGGAGNDRLLIQSYTYATVLDGGDGVDTLDLTDHSGAGGVTFSLAGGNTGALAQLSVINVENVVGGSRDDRLTGDAGVNRISGAGGNDLLDGGAGNDVLDGGGGYDTADYSGRSDWVVVTVTGGTDVAYIGGHAEDTLIGVEGVKGGSGDDTLTWNLPSSIRGGLLDGGAGDDRLIGFVQNGAMVGGAGVDTVEFSSVTTDLVVVYQFSDGYYAASSSMRLYDIENIVGGHGNDFIVASNAANILDGGAGDDDLFGFGGADTLTGGAGADRFELISHATYGYQSGIDHITDFDAAEGDRIGVTGFAAYPWNNDEEGFDDASFISGAGMTSAATAGQHLIYNTTDGALYYDEDGAGGAASVLIAVLDGAPTLTGADFFLNN